MTSLSKFLSWSHVWEYFDLTQMQLKLLITHRWHCSIPLMIIHLQNPSLYTRFKLHFEVKVKLPEVHFDLSPSLFWPILLRKPQNSKNRTKSILSLLILNWWATSAWTRIIINFVTFNFLHIDFLSLDYRYNFNCLVSFNVIAVFRNIHSSSEQVFSPRKFDTKNAINIDTTFNITAITYSGCDNSVNKEWLWVDVQNNIFVIW